MSSFMPAEFNDDDNAVMPARYYGMFSSERRSPWPVDMQCAMAASTVIRRVTP